MHNKYDILSIIQYTGQQHLLFFYSLFIAAQWSVMLLSAPYICAAPIPIQPSLLGKIWPQGDKMTNLEREDKT